MVPMQRLLSIGAMLALGACTTALPPAKTPALGIPFNEEAKQGYVRLASSQWSEADLVDYRHFQRKAERAMLGNIVWPDRVASREGLPPEARTEALAHRERLVNLLEFGGRVTAPADAAVAQVTFDCWLEEFEANPGSADAAVCKDALLAALDQVEASLVPLEPFVVLFPRGSAELDQEALAVIRAAARVAGRADPERIDVVGYADPTGSPASNLEVSQARARAVADQLVAAGIPAGTLNLDARGGAQISPINAENRRVEISFAR